VKRSKGLVDTCAALDVDVHVNLGRTDLLAGHINICLCISVLHNFLDSHPVAKKVINGVGRDKACDYFTDLVNNQDSKRECHYPAHAVPFCNIKSPCDFTCDKGYTSSPSTNPTACVCNPPSIVSNGVCGTSPRGAASQVPTRKRYYPTCETGKTMCGVPNGGKGYDCVDINTNVESCGGCVVASPFGNNVADGKNCKTIPNVDEAVCDAGTCKVVSCKNGLNVSNSHDSCVMPRLDRVRQVRSGDEM